MIDLYYWPTPNGHKITLFLEEAALDYRIHPIDISAGDQFKPEFLAFSPNNRMPAIIDNEPADGGEPVSVFESGAILLYLTEKVGQFLPTDIRGRKTVMEWLFWQVGGLGPMAGQNHHFGLYAPEKISLRDRSIRQGDQSALRGARSSVGEPRVHSWRELHDRRYGLLSLDRSVEAATAEPRRFPKPSSLVRTHCRPAGDGARLRQGRALLQRPAVTEEGKKILFGQTAASAKGR
jgi:GST-like protein